MIPPVGPIAAEHIARWFLSARYLRARIALQHTLKSGKVGALLAGLGFDAERNGAACPVGELGDVENERGWR
jgi:hypothetical protein